MKKYLSIIMSVVLFCGMTFSVSAKEDGAGDTISVSESSIYMNSSDKSSFADEMDATYQMSNKKGEVKTGTQQEIDQIIEAATLATGDEQRELLHMWDINGMGHVSMMRILKPIQE